MDYQLLNKLVREVENEKFTSKGDVEYSYLQEELYAVRFTNTKETVLLKAKNPDEACLKFLRLGKHQIVNVTGKNHTFIGSVENLTL